MDPCVVSKGEYVCYFFWRCLSEIRMFNHTLPCYWCSASAETTFAVWCSKISETTTMDSTENKINRFNLMVWNANFGVADCLITREPNLSKTCHVHCASWVAIKSKLKSNQFKKVSFSFLKWISLFCLCKHFCQTLCF